MGAATQRVAEVITCYVNAAIAMGLRKVKMQGFIIYFLMVAGEWMLFRFPRQKEQNCVPMLLSIHY